MNEYDEYGYGYEWDYDDWDSGERGHCWACNMYLCKDLHGNVYVHEIEMRGLDYPDEVFYEAKYGLKCCDILTRLRLRRLAKTLPPGDLLDISYLREEPQIIRISKHTPMPPPYRF